jgi:hypothetical protein
VRRTYRRFHIRNDRRAQNSDLPGKIDRSLFRLANAVPDMNERRDNHRSTTLRGTEAPRLLGKFPLCLCASVCRELQD